MTKPKALAKNIAGITLMYLAPLTGGAVADESKKNTSPACPAPAISTIPEYAEPGSQANYAVWQNLNSLPGNCRITVSPPFDMTVALAAQFTYMDTSKELAERIGAITAMQEITYWSVSDKAWRNLISRAVALSRPDNGSERGDFTAAEVLSGNPLYFAQNDTRSWGLNVYALKTLSATTDKVVFLSENISPVKLGPVTLFKPRTAQTVITIHKVNDTTWSFYSVAVLQKSSIGSNEKSLINRQAALFRFLTGKPLDQEPPLAP